MKKIILAVAVLILLTVACTSNQLVLETPISLNGTAWQLEYIKDSKIDFEVLYPDKKPSINFDINEENYVGGYSGCNQYFGTFILDGNQINFRDSRIAMTKIYCAGEGEDTYMNALNKVSFFSISADGKLLRFFAQDIELMRFKKIE